MEKMEINITLNKEQEDIIVERLFKELQEVIVDGANQIIGNQYLTKKELANMLSVSENTIMSMRDEGLPYIKFRQTVRYNVEEVKKWLRTACEE